MSNSKLHCAPWALGPKHSLRTPKAVTYHEQPDYCRFMIGHSLGRMESRIKKFTPHSCLQALADAEQNGMRQRLDTAGQPQILTPHLDLGRAPYCYVLYGVNYIGPVSLPPFAGPPISNYNAAPLCFFKWRKIWIQYVFWSQHLGCPSTSGDGTKTRLESRIKKFTPCGVCRPT